MTTLTAALFIVALVIGWLGRDFWNFATELLDIYREER
jgi:hypothetical protein